MDDEVSSTTVDETEVGKGKVASCPPATSEVAPDEDDKSVDGTNPSASIDGNLNQKKRKSTDRDEEVKELAGNASPLGTVVDEDMEGNDTANENGNTAEASPVQPDLAVTKEVKPAEPEPEPEPKIAEVEVDIRVMFNKQLIPVRISLKKTVGDLKRVLEVQTKVLPECQKILIKGIPKDHVTLESLGISAGAKILVIGTKLDDILSVSTPPTASELKGTSESAATSDSQNWCSIPRHQKIIDRGVPDDAMPGIRDVTDPLPPFPLSGMVGSKGSKVRLTFKLEADELWIGTKERTDKVAIGSIRHVVSQPITGLEHYHILAIQLGPTEASRFFIYWVPAQFIAAIKQALGV